MPAKRYSVEQIVAKLREAEKHQAHELAAAHPRWGYRRVWSLLRDEGWRVNRKRIERLSCWVFDRVTGRRRETYGS